MQQEQIILYIRENIMAVAIATAGLSLLIWLLILFQVTRTRREVHKICKKIRRYFDVILADETKEASEETETAKEDGQAVKASEEEEQLLRKAQKDEEDAKLLMEVISEVF